MQQPVPTHVEFELASVGSLVAYKLRGSAARLPRGGERKAITRFSARALKNFVFKVSRLDVPGKALFMTLTYPDQYSQQSVDWKKHLDRFLVYLKRRGAVGKKACIVWRMEFQKRGAPHFHLLLWNLCSAAYVLMDMDQGRASKIRRAWYRFVGSGDLHHLDHGVHADYVRHGDKTGAYLTKEMSKTVQNADGLYGRYWGMSGRKYMTFKTVKTYTVRLCGSQADMVESVQTLIPELNRMNMGYVPEKWEEWRSRHYVLLDDPMFVWEYALEFVPF